MTQKGKARQKAAKFRVNWVVALRGETKKMEQPVYRIESFDGIFYRLRGLDDTTWREEELRLLESREIGPRRGAK